MSLLSNPSHGFSQKAIEYGTFHAYDPQGLEAWCSAMEKDLEFSIPTVICGDKSLPSIIQNLENITVLLHCLQDRGYTLLSLVNPNGTFSLTKTKKEKKKKRNI